MKNEVHGIEMNHPNPIGPLRNTNFEGIFIGKWYFAMKQISSRQ